VYGLSREAARNASATVVSDVLKGSLASRLRGSKTPLLPKELKGVKIVLATSEIDFVH
jgi:hypothetical protein